MYSILIVDDEKKEREGIARLIKKYGIKLNVILAENGEDALRKFEKNRCDILLTDIKMPFMDGIELIREVQKRNYNPICIIYSAYGEFEYAQNAISLGVQEYLLKPIRLEAFETLFKKVIGLCKSRETIVEEKKRLISVEDEVAAYKLGWRLLSFLEKSDKEKRDSLILDEIKELEYLMCMNEDMNCVPVIISCYNNLFSAEWENYQKIIEDCLGQNSLIINKDETQILVICRDTKVVMKQIKEQSMRLIKESKYKFNTDIFMVVGNKTNNLEDLKLEYERIKEQLDYQFFVTESMVIVEDLSFFTKKEQNMLDLYFERIFNCAKIKDLKGIKKELEKAFQYIEKNTGFSSIYIKYTFSDLIKRVMEYTNTKIDIVQCIEKIYAARSMDAVKNEIFNILDEINLYQEKHTKENRLIHMTKDIIHEKYGDSLLCVSYIAKELDVTTAYLSSLFKAETGINLVKFITRYRIDKSKELLKQSNIKVSEIARRVGYVSNSYYTSIFRNQEGMSPLQYREQADEK